MKVARPTLPDAPGRRILVAAWITVALFVVVALPAALGASAFEAPVAIYGLASLGVGFAVWIVAFFRAAARTTRGDDIVVASWVFLQDAAPGPVRRHLLGAAAAALVITFATAVGSPFVWLADLLPLGWCALWSAWHGTFPARRPPSPLAPRGRPHAAPRSRAKQADDKPTQGTASGGHRGRPGK